MDAGGQPDATHLDATRLARLEHENLIEAVRAYGSQVAGGRVERMGGVSMVATGLPLFLFNQVLIEASGGGAANAPADEAPPFEAQAEAIASAVSIMRERHDRFAVNLRRGPDDRFRPLMERFGLIPLPDNPWLPGMAMHSLPTAGSAPPGAGHEIRRVTDPSGLADHVITAADGFGMPVSWVEAVMSDAVLAHPDAFVYVGYTDGAPVTSGLGFRTGRTIGVYNIATVESARRRGYGAAMTMRIVDDGAAAGCDVAILQASEMGLPIYERLGFRLVLEYDAFVDPASLRAAG